MCFGKLSCGSATAGETAAVPCGGYVSCYLFHLGCVHLSCLQLKPRYYTMLYRGRVLQVSMEAFSRGRGLVLGDRAQRVIRSQAFGLDRWLNWCHVLLLCTIYEACRHGCGASLVGLAFMQSTNVKWALSKFIFFWFGHLLPNFVQLLL